MLNPDEWLPQAQRLAVGMKMRVRHLHEGRANLLIANDNAKWWAYCHRCHEGGVVEKTHVQLGPNRGAPREALAVPTDAVALVGSPYERRALDFLVTKGMALEYLPPLWVSPSTGRLLLSTAPGEWHGRDLTGKSPAKWLHYGTRFVGAVHASDTVVVTEDLFSMYKVRFALRLKPGVSVCSTLGAHCDATAVLRLVLAGRIVWAYDGDLAGDQGYTQASRRMQVFDIPQIRMRPPEGMDPKDMDCPAIRALYEKELNHAGEL